MRLRLLLIGHDDLLWLSLAPVITPMKLEGWQMVSCTPDACRRMERLVVSPGKTLPSQLLGPEPSPNDFDHTGAFVDGRGHDLETQGVLQTFLNTTPALWIFDPRDTPLPTLTAGAMMRTPLSPKDLISLWRRTWYRHVVRAAPRCWGGFSCDPIQRRLTHIPSRTFVTLTEKESELLGYLLTHAPRSVPREQLLKTLWGYGETVDTRTLEAFVYQIRQKLVTAFGRKTPLIQVVCQNGSYGLSTPTAA